MPLCVAELLGMDQQRCFVAIIEWCVALSCFDQRNGSSLCHGFCCAVGQAVALLLSGCLAELLFDACTLLQLIFPPCLLRRCGCCHARHLSGDLNWSTYAVCLELLGSPAGPTTWCGEPHVCAIVVQGQGLKCDNMRIRHEFGYISFQALAIVVHYHFILAQNNA